MSSYQPSPYQVHPPSFSSPLDQVINGVQPAPTRGALVERAFGLTRTSSLKRTDKTQLRRGGAHVAAQDGGATARTPFEGAELHMRHKGQPHRTDARPPVFAPQPTACPDANSDSAAAMKNKARVQHLRAARLSQQQAVSPEQPSSMEATTSQSSPQQSAPLQGSAPLSNAFRDSVASDFSFNSITGPDERSSMMLMNNEHFGAASQDADEFAQDADRIAQEVRGLAMRRRPSMDTVRSSEFGEGGRWAKAWAGSEDGYEDEEEDELDLQAMRARDMTALDIESSSSHSGLGALGNLGSIQGARAAMSLAGQFGSNALPRLQDAAGAKHTVSLTPSYRTTSTEHGNSYTASAASPQLHQSGNLSVLSKPSRRDTITSIAGEIDVTSDATDEIPCQSHARNDSTSTVSTITGSMRSGANTNVMVWPPTPSGSEQGSAQGHRDGHLRTVPPASALDVGHRAIVEYAEPAEPERHISSRQQDSSSSFASKPLSPSAVLARPLDEPLLGDQRAKGRETSNARENHHAPVNLNTFAGYSDPNQNSAGTPFDHLGQARKKAIADRDGRESLVSDLDVETLRLEGSSVAGSHDEWGSRRGSTSTIGSVSSVELNEQRKRRSQMERQDVASAGYDERRASTATIRGQASIDRLGEQSNQRPQRSQAEYSYEQQKLPFGQGYPSTRVQALQSSTKDGTPLKRNVSHPSPVKEKPDPIGTRPPQPRRSNTLPDEQQEQQQSTPKLGPAPWAVQRSRNSLTGPPAVGQSAMPSRSSSGDSLTPGSVRSPNLGSTEMSPSMRSMNASSISSPYSSKSTLASTNKRASAPAQSQAEKFLTLGISHHESGDLSRSAYYFERSAKVDGGCVVGMCMWGMALREGWGVRKDQKRGFDWISRAATRAGELMSGKGGTGDGGQKARTESELKATRSELKLSVYELGKCFCYGWGVKMDKQMALDYFELAAKLGDADAQAEAGALLAAGKGCKKDLKKAAMYYRMAEAQGYDTVGLSWIHKDKYDPSPVMGDK